MTENSLLRLLKTCLVLEIRACEIYTELASHGGVDKLKRFWQQMADEEQHHIRFWNRVIDQAQNQMLPKFIDNPEEIRAELMEIGDKIETKTEIWQDRYHKTI